MRKIYLIFIFALSLIVVDSLKAQQSYYLAPTGTQTTTVRGPNGSSAHSFLRGVFLVTASELTSINTVTALNSFGFHLQRGTNGTPVTGTLNVYFENTNDVTYQKGTSWPSAIGAMTQVYNSTMTIPATSANTLLNMPLSSAFNYTGGGIYVAYDWETAGPFPTNTILATYFSETTINPGGASNSSAAAPAPTVISTTNFRPNFNFGYVNTFTNEIAVQQAIGYGKIPLIPGSPHTFSAVVKNMAGVTATNVQLDLQMAGANNFTTQAIIPSIAPNATIMATIPGFTPTNQGLSTVTISVPSDENNTNNMAVTNQSVTCEVLCAAPASLAVGDYSTGVGFPTGTGKILSRIRTAQTESITAIKIAISNDNASVGKPVYAVLTASNGVHMATTNTIVLTAQHLNKYVQFDLPNPITLTNTTYYHIGLAQPVAGHFPTGATPSSYIPPFWYYTATLTSGLFTLPNNLGRFGIEAVFYNGIDLAVNSATLCSGETATLLAGTAASYSWNTGPTSNSIVVTPSVSTNYMVTGTTGSCSVMKTAYVTVNPTPTISVPDGGICPPPGSHTFMPSGASTYTYSGGSATVTPTVTTTYTVVGTSSLGCVSNTVTPTVYVQNGVTVTITSPTAICLGQSGTLSASGAASYSWTTGGLTNSIVVSPTVSNTYGVLGTIGTCTNFATNLLVVNPNPTVNATSANPYNLYCTGSNGATLTATGANTYTWSTSATGPTVIVTPSIVTTYSVAGADVNGCVGIKYITVGLAPAANINASTSTPTICVNETATLTATGGVTYTWTGNTSTTSIAVVSPSTTTIYTVSGTDMNGCVNTYTIEQFVDPCTGFNEFDPSNYKISLFPNPANNSFNLNVSSLTKNMKFETYNNLGQLIFTESVSSENTIVDISNLSKGLYFVKVKDGDVILSTIKVIKE